MSGTYIIVSSGDHFLHISYTSKMPHQQPNNLINSISPSRVDDQRRSHRYWHYTGAFRLPDSYLGQMIAALAVSLGPFAAGLGKGYSSPAIASLQQSEAQAFVLNAQQASWLASLSLLGALFGAPIGGAAMRWGRRRTLIIFGGLLSACWVITVFAVNVEVMCAAAFMSGFFVAIIQLAAQDIRKRICRRLFYLSE